MLRILFHYLYNQFYLVIMEDGVCKSVLSWYCSRPQFLHEEHLVCQRGNDTWAWKKSRHRPLPD